MTKSRPYDEDRRFEELFRSADEPVSQDDFAAKVMTRLRRRSWARRATLVTAVALGAIVSVPPALELAAVVAEALLWETTRWSITTTPDEYLRPAFATVVVLMWPAVLRWLAR